MSVLPWAATALGAVPLAFVLSRHFAARWFPRHVWLMALGFGVSFLADVAGAFGAWSVVSQVYLVSQAGLFALALRPDRVVPVLGLVVAAAGASLALRHGAGLDVLLHVTAFLSVVWCAWTADTHDHDTRVILATGFIWMAVAWGVYASAPALATWAVFQSVRLALTVGWCVAVARAER